MQSMSKETGKSVLRGNHIEEKILIKQMWEKEKYTISTAIVSICT